MNFVQIGARDNFWWSIIVVVRLPYKFGAHESGYMYIIFYLDKHHASFLLRCINEGNKKIYIHILMSKAKLRRSWF